VAQDFAVGSWSRRSAWQLPVQVARSDFGGVCGPWQLAHVAWPGRACRPWRPLDPPSAWHEPHAGGFATPPGPWDRWHDAHPCAVALAWRAFALSAWQLVQVAASGRRAPECAS
jgi:hypothetical protein